MPPASGAPTRTLDRLLAADLSLCLWIHRRAGRSLRRAFSLASRLGNGWIWPIVAISILAIVGESGWIAIGRMAVAVALGLTLYKLLKRRTARPRPCDIGAGIRAWVPAPDRYSFPSGHALHAVALTLIACHAVPALALVLVPLAVAIGLSRIVLGLHYPSDVAAGAGLGSLIALITLWAT